MDPNIAASAVPMTAWEQAVIVVLFIVFLGGVFAFVRWILNWNSKQQKMFQEFTEKLNRQWRDWMDGQHELDREAMFGVTNSLEKLGAKIDAHDSKVDQRVESVVSKVTAAKRRKPSD